MKEILKQMGRMKVKRAVLADIVAEKEGICKAHAYRKIKDLLLRRILFTDGSYIYAEPIKVEMVRSW